MQLPKNCSSKSDSPPSNLLLKQLNHWINLFTQRPRHTNFQRPFLGWSLLCHYFKSIQILTFHQTFDFKISLPPYQTFPVQKSNQTEHILLFSIMATPQNKRYQAFECILRRATKFISQHYKSDYKSHLTTLHLLPLSLWFEYLDITFLIKCLKDPSDYFNLSSFIKYFSNKSQASYRGKLKFTLPRSSINAAYFF